MNLYKKCFIPTCGNDSLNSPNKIIVRIREDLREKWCREANVEYFKVHTMYCCEDHFNPKEDLKNYYGCKDFNQEPVLKPTAMLRNIASNFQTETPYMPQSENSELFKLLLQNQAKKRKCEDINMPSTSASTTSTIPIKLKEDLENYEQYVSGAKPKLKLDATLKNIPRKVDDNAFEASPSEAVGNTETQNNVKAAFQCESVPLEDKSVMDQPKTKNKNTDLRAKLSHLPESEKSHYQSSSLFGTSNLESSTSTSGQSDQKFGRNYLLESIKNKPKMYLGVPKNFWWVIDFIAKEYSSLALHIILTLFKIKNNDTFMRMSDEFEMVKSTISAIFEKNVIILATYFKKLIYLPSPFEVKKELPLVFKIRYPNVQIIFDCFEIEIEKPSDPAKLAQTLSQYYSCNTIKYLIGCTPAGLVCFISKGYGGRISDKSIAQKSGFIDILPPNAVIMADGGLKQIEELVSTKNIKLLCPPSVLANKKNTKKEVIESKLIASLQVHMQRIVRKVREFQMLKPHSVVIRNHIKYLDEIVLIACGLINLQGPTIKADR